MTDHPNAIPLDEATNLTDQSFEIARLWVTHGGGSTVWIASQIMTDPAAFGRLLSDVVRHASVAYATDGRTQGEAVGAILNALAAGLRPDNANDDDDSEGDE